MDKSQYENYLLDLGVRLKEKVLVPRHDEFEELQTH
jgi:hypothetical protein